MLFAFLEYVETAIFCACKSNVKNCYTESVYMILNHDERDIVLNSRIFVLCLPLSRLAVHTPTTAALAISPT